MSRSAFIIFALLCIQSSPVSAVSIEDFSGYKAGDLFIPGEISPTKGTGWLDGWRSANSYVQVTGHFVATPPLVDSGQYLAVTFDSIPGEHESNPSGSVTLPYLRPAKPFKLSFKFRPDIPAKDIRYFLFDNNTRSAGVSPLASWLIVSQDGKWQLLNGENNGLPSEMVPTDMPVTAGTTYGFSLEINPDARSWAVTITDGKRTVTHKNLHFRSYDFTPERCLVFGANETTAPALGLTVRFALDSISIQP
jgi:hypothetical protein